MFARILSIFLSFCLLNIPSFAGFVPEDFSLCDLSSAGIAPMRAAPAETIPVLDGKIENGEYSVCNQISFGSGLSLAFGRGEEAASKAEALPLNEGNFIQNTYIAYDENSIYLGFFLSFPKKLRAATLHPQLGSVYPFSVSLGLGDFEDPLAHFPYFTNTYFLSAESFLCAGVSGIRNLPAAEGSPIIMRRISSFSSLYLGGGLTTSDGVFCDGAYYCGKIAASRSMDGEHQKVILEISLPLEDVLSSVFEEDRKKVKEILALQEGELCGSMISEFYLFDPAFDSLRVVAGVPVNSPCALLGFSQNWKDLICGMDSAFQGADVIEILPIPIYFVGSPPLPQSFATKKSDFQEEESASSVSASLLEEEKALEESEEAPSSEGEEIWEDESIFDSLPNAGDLVPEEVERIELSQSNSENDSAASASPIASVLLITGGFFILISAFVCLLFLREREKKEEKEKNTSK